METAKNLGWTSALLASLVLSLTSCAATGESFRPGESIPGQAFLYIYRLRGMTGAAMSWDVYLDEGKLTELRHGGYFYTPIGPGPHTLLVKVHTGVSLQVLAEADKRYYFRVRASTNVLVHTFVLERVEESLAVYELAQMKLQPRKED